MSALDVKTLSYEEKQIHTPSLEIVQSILTNGLKSNFSEVIVDVVDCPDLSKAPFHLAAPGLGGDTTIVEFGGPPFLLPLVDRSKVYDLVPLIRNIDGYHEKDFFTCGAGAGPWPIHNQNCEGIINLRVRGDEALKNGTHIVRTVVGGIEVSKVPHEDTRSALLGNLFLSEGIQSGKVLKIITKKRIGNENFISAMRLALSEYFTDEKTVGLGGVFILKKGAARIHVMDQFSETPLNSEEDLNRWLTFHNFDAPLIAVGTLVTNEADLDLRLQHFHCFSKHGQGGHYHYDTTPETVEYEGYFNVGSRIVRIDKPVVTHKVGRD